MRVGDHATMIPNQNACRLLILMPPDVCSYNDDSRSRRRKNAGGVITYRWPPYFPRPNKLCHRRDTFRQKSAQDGGACNYFYSVTFSLHGRQADFLWLTGVRDVPGLNMWGRRPGRLAPAPSLSPPVLSRRVHRIFFATFGTNVGEITVKR